MAKHMPKSMVQVYVWQLPVRIYHWLNFVAVIVLCATGYVISNPPAISSVTEASHQYWFGKVRFVHFLTAYVFLFNFLARLYWGFFGNRYASWRNFIPYTRPYWREVRDVLTLDILQKRGQALISIGHNAMAGLTYFLLFLAFAFQVVTGFGLYAAMSASWFPQLFAWVVPIMGGDYGVRQWHHMMMWFFIIVGVVHTYLVFYHDYVEGRGTMSSMVGGWKFIDREEYDEREEYEEARRRDEAS